MGILYCPWEPAKYLIYSANVPAILYYALIPGMAASLFFGFFVFLKNRKYLPSIILLAISIFFFIWGFFNLILFATNDPNTVIVLWAYQILVEVLMYAASLYLAYAFFFKKDAALKVKLLVLLLLAPVIAVLPTWQNLKGVILADCTAMESIFIIYYSYSLEIFFALLIASLAVIKFRKENDLREKRQAVVFTFGMVLFLLTFSSGNIIGSFTSDWVASQYGYFGMPIFIGFLAYLTVRYRAFNVKLMATQALVLGLIGLTASELFFAESAMNQILIYITLLISVIFGLMLVRSVKLEVQRKEELEGLSIQLATANDKLHRLDKAKSEFISIASHQLRTPLTSIKGFGSLLLEGTYGAVAEAQRNALEKIYISNERLIHLVEDLLNVSRMEAGRLEFDFQESQIEDLVQEAVDTLDFSAKAKNLYLHWQKPALPLPKISLDMNKVKEVISNMVDNAIKYTPKGGVTVKAEQGSFYDHDEKVQKSVVRIIVSDTGIGMDKSDLDNIFNKFERGKQVSHYHTDGTGLGMYVGKKVVEAHHGRIWAESEGRGKGSKFILELPISVS